MKMLTAMKATLSTSKVEIMIELAKLSNQSMRLHTKAIQSMNKSDAEYLLMMSENAENMLYHIYNMSHAEIDMLCDEVRDES